MPNVHLRKRRLLMSLAITGMAGMTKLTLASVDETTRSKGNTMGGVDVNPRLFSFVGGTAGAWRVDRVSVVIGESLPLVSRMDVVHGTASSLPDGAKWALRGVTSNVRYVNRSEQNNLVAKQVAPGRKEASHAALIPIKKSTAWWELPQDERRKIFEESSHHIAVGLKYLPAIARRLHHCRELGETEPFDFLTWFDYAPDNAGAFEDLVGELRGTDEWKFVEREVDIRLTR
jgi:hypothetical protein